MMTATHGIAGAAIDPFVPFDILTATPLNFIDAINFNVFGSFTYSLDGGSSFLSGSGSPFNISGIPSGDIIVRPDALFSLNKINFQSKDFFSSITINDQTGYIGTCDFMFFGLGAMTSIDLTNFNTSNVTTMQSMFDSFPIPIVGIQNFNTSNVTTMQSMFNGYLPSSLDVSSFDISNVTVMSTMFFNSNITSLDLSTMIFTAGIDFGFIFADMNDLICITNIDTTSASSTNTMFRNNTALTAPNAAEQTAILAGSNYVNASPCP